MKNSLARVLKLVTVASLLALGVATLSAQGPATARKPAGKWVPERLADGHPDLQGVWANNTVTPLERPKAWEGKTTLTDQEVADFYMRAHDFGMRRGQKWLHFGHAPFDTWSEVIAYLRAHAATE